ncbi:rCG33680 [Rattus norvegicus]|uniref:RCG33680 n=1 Tax=Rattus norvegicus TaxID=10116 RepID=A6HGC6_RAT|nr:rCG33680 [Rattus norvegicus]
MRQHKVCSRKLINPAAQPCHLDSWERGSSLKGILESRWPGSGFEAIFKAGRVWSGL